MPPKQKPSEKPNPNIPQDSSAPLPKAQLSKVKPQKEGTSKESLNSKRITTATEPTKRERVLSAKERKKETTKGIKPSLPGIQNDASRGETSTKADQQWRRGTKVFQKEDYESKKKGKKEIDAEEVLEGDKPGSVAIFGRGSAKKRNKIVVEEEPPAVHDDLKIPTLWIRGGNGIVHLLEKPPDAEAAVAPSAEKKKGKRRKKKLRKTDSFKDFYETNKKPTAHGRSRSGSTKSFFKPDSGKKTGPVYAAFLINEEMLKLSTAVGVKITLDAYVEPSKEEKKESVLESIGIVPHDEILMDMNVAFHSKPSKIDLLPQMGMKEKKREPAPVVRKKPVFKAKTKGLKKGTYMHHTPHPNLMTPLFDLPPIRQILYGPFQDKVERVVLEVRKPVMYRGQEQLIFPDNSFASDSTFIERIVKMGKI
ncbi:hypothetical protein HDV01_000086 [Terramyces sp. JEL0728]|nr:hypothetical protein HDV01_000086 [Terramyces sp. JEL0728]